MSAPNGNGDMRWFIQQIAATDDDERLSMPEVDGALSGPVPPGIEHAHLAAIIAAARAPVPTRRDALFARRVTRFAAAAVVAFTLTAGLAAGGRLPTAAQRVVASTMTHVGVHIVRPGDDALALSRRRSFAIHAEGKRVPGASVNAWRTVVCRCTTRAEAESTLNALWLDRTFFRWDWTIEKVRANKTTYFYVEHVFISERARSDAAELAGRLRGAGHADAIHEVIKAL